jgi:hypothetical protein
VHKSEADPISFLHPPHIWPGLFDISNPFVPKYTSGVKEVLICPTDTGVRNTNKDVVGSKYARGLVGDNFTRFAPTINFKGHFSL